MDVPIDRLLGQVSNPFPVRLRVLSVDPYDAALMLRIIFLAEPANGPIVTTESELAVAAVL